MAEVSSAASKEITGVIEYRADRDKVMKEVFSPVLWHYTVYKYIEDTVEG